MISSWFDTVGCVKLEIKKYQSISEHQVVRAVTIEDTDAIKKLMQRIEGLPTEGEKMVSWGPDVEVIDLCFHSNDHPTQKVEIYQGRFKTPSTGFNRINEAESSIYSDVSALLFPAFSKRLLKIENLEVRFEDFSITYLGIERSTPAPISASWSSDRFLVKDANNTEQRIEIISGQRSPAPHHFEIGSAGFTLLTYESETQERLFPDYFQVIVHK